jgi:hypothetical protein
MQQRLGRCGQQRPAWDGRAVLTGTLLHAAVEQPTPLSAVLRRAQRIKQGGTLPAGSSSSSSSGGPAGKEAAGAAAAMFGDLEARSQLGKDGKRYTINFVPKQLQLGPLFGGGWYRRRRRRHRRRRRLS